jgi:hypothetical protein
MKKRLSNSDASHMRHCIKKARFCGFLSDRGSAGREVPDDVDSEINGET